SRVEQGSVVSPFYDSLLAKIIAHGPDRHTALERLASALAETRVEGVKSNLDLLLAVVGSDDFTNGEVHTAFVEQHGLDHGPAAPPEELLIAAAASEVLQVRAPVSEPGDPWMIAGPWRVGWVGTEIWYRYAGRTLRVGLAPVWSSDDLWRFQLPDSERECTVRLIDTSLVEVQDQSSVVRVHVRRDGNERVVGAGPRFARLELVSAFVAEHESSVASSAGLVEDVRAPMPGRITKVSVADGDTVRANQVLCVLEAMKIEHLVTAPNGGAVKCVRCQVGDQVELGAVLIELEA